MRVTSSVGVGAYQVTFRFNPAIVTLTPSNVTGGTAPFDQTPTTVNIDNTAGEVTLNAFQTTGSPTGAFTVAKR